MEKNPLDNSEVINIEISLLELITLGAHLSDYLSKMQPITKQMIDDNGMDNLNKEQFILVAKTATLISFLERITDIHRDYKKTH